MLNRIFIFTLATQFAVGYKHVDSRISDDSDTGYLIQNYGRKSARIGDVTRSTCAWSPDTLSCPSGSSGQSNKNDYCARMIDSLLGLVVGTPEPQTTVASAFLGSSDTIVPNKSISQQDVIGMNQNITQICCFLVSFPGAKDKCCSEISQLCNFGQRLSCNWPCDSPNTSGSSNVGSNSGHGPCVTGGSSGGDENWTGDGGDSVDTTEEGGYFSGLINRAYNFMKRVIGAD